MKKIMIAVLALAMLAGCEKKVQEIPEEEPEETEVVEETGKIWTVEPGIEVENVRTMEPFEKTEVLYESENYGQLHVLGDFERIGYPQEWMGSSCDTDAVIIEKNGSNGIWNYEGEELSPADINIHSTPFAAGIGPARLDNGDGTFSFVYGYANSASQKGVYFSDDYSERLEAGLDVYAYDPYHDERLQPFFCVQDGVFGVAVPTWTEDHPVYGFTFEPFAGGELPGNLIAPVVDPVCRKQSYVLCDSFGNVLMDTVTSRGSYVEGTYINGHYIVSTTEDVAFIHAMTATQISWSYHAAGYFSDGYAPVKKYGKWGFIDEMGNEVTDFIFSDVTELGNGRSYVRYNGTYGILNLKEALANGKQLNIYTLYGNTDEKPIGKVTVNVSDLNIRSGTGVDYESVGNSLEGTSYPVFETAEAESYTWYRIDASHWIPSDGEWLSYEEGADAWQN
ncbi:MAG: WG repeat-containing protein [Erysipelotrichaceae bacterium]|nr:WG repeat-containing protein [Erysipelotrichaceae bacterium]